MAVSIITKLTDLLKLIGIDSSKYLGKVDPNVKQFVPLTGTTARKPGLIRALSKDDKTFKPSDVKEVFEKDAQYMGQMNEMELQNFYNNVQDYVKAGGKQENIPSNVVTQEGKLLEGKKLEKLSERKGAPEKFDESLQGGLRGIMALVDEIQGITPRERNTKNRRELAEFIYNMRGKEFTNEQIKMIRAYMDDDYSIGFAKDKASAMLIGKKMGAKDIDEFELVDEYIDNVNSYSPKDFKETYGNVKHINMEISSLIDKKLQRHFKKKYKWDDTKKDGGLDDKTYEMYDDEFFEASKKFSNFHTMFDTNQRPNIFGIRKGKSWANHPNNYLDEASEEMERITGKGLNVEFLKKFTDDALTRYPEPEKFQAGGSVTSTGLNYLLGEDDNNRMPFKNGLLVPPEKPRALIMLDTLNSKAAYNTLGPRTYFNMVAKFATEAKDKGDISERQYMEIMQPFFGKGGEAITRKIDEEREYLDKYADGGRIGFQEGGGIESRLEQLGGDVTSAEQLLQELNERIQSAGSSIPEGGVDPNSNAGIANPNGTLATLAAYTPQPRPSGGYLGDGQLSQLPTGGIGSLEPAGSGIFAGRPVDTGGQIQQLPGIGNQFSQVTPPQTLVAAQQPMSEQPGNIPGTDVPYSTLRGGMQSLLQTASSKENLQNALPGLFADGGRANFSNGGMSRRTFLKFLGGLAAVPVIGKFVKPFAKAGKGITSVPIIKTAPVEGKPEWFDALVNRVVREGEDMTKKFATKEREIVHATKIDEDTYVRVTQDLDEGTIRVEYESDANVYGDPVQLQYKKPLPDERAPNPAAEFTTAESGPVGRSFGPDDYDIELDEVGGTSIRDLDSDVSKLKEYATGKKLTMKEIVASKKRRDRAKDISEGGEAESDAVTRRQGDYIQFEDIDPEVDYATGGRVGFMAGGIGKTFKLAKKFRESPEYKKFIEKLFLKTSTDIRRGEGAFKNISVDEKIKMHDDLTKAVVDYQKTGELPESTHQYFGFNPEMQYAETLMQKQLKMTPEQELRQEFPGISDEMVNNILTDTNQQRIAEVKATMKEALKMQEKGMGVDEIIQVIEKTPRTKNASGGLAGMLGE